MAEPDGWLSVSDLARVRGVDKAAISRRVTRASGAISTRPGPGRSKLINVAEFSRVIAETTDVVREANGRRAVRARDIEGITTSSGLEPRVIQTLTSARTISEAQRSQLLQLELDERRGKLMQVRKVEDALVAAGEKIVRITDQLPMDADDLATSVARGGAQALRHALKEIARRMRTRIADALSLNGHST